MPAANNLLKTVHPASLGACSAEEAVDRRAVLARTLELIGERRSDPVTAVREVALENRESALNTPFPADPRLRVIGETRRRLQGSLLTPRDRRAVIDYGVGLGLPHFDTTLLIAMVQDRSRRGQDLDPIELAGTCRLTDGKEPARGERTSDIDLALRLLVAAVGGLGLALIAMHWLTG